MTSMTFQPGSVEFAFNHFRNASAPRVVEQPGSLGILGAGIRQTGYGCAISFWESRDALERSNGVPSVIEAMSGYGKWMASPFKVESYTVVSGEIPVPGPDNLIGTWMRATIIAPVPNSHDKVEAIYAERLSTTRATNPECFGAFLLALQVGSGLLAIELWNDHSALADWDSSAKVRDQRLFRAGTVDRPPLREALEIFGLY
jgi:hypothetical protein